jgi:hypothetical protein
MHAGMRWLPIAQLDQLIVAILAFLNARLLGNLGQLRADRVLFANLVVAVGNKSIACEFGGIRNTQCGPGNVRDVLHLIGRKFENVALTHKLGIVEPAFVKEFLCL